MLGPRRDPARCLGGRRRLGALVPSPLGAAAARSGSAARWGAAARSGGGVPARAARNRRRESDPTPFKRRTPGRPCLAPNTQHPTPKHPTPKHPTPKHPSTQRSAVAIPTGHLQRRWLYRPDVLDEGFQTSHRSPGKATSSPPWSTQHPTPTQHPPNTQHPTPNARRLQALQGTYSDYDYTAVMPSTGASRPAVEIPVK